MNYSMKNIKGKNPRDWDKEQTSLVYPSLYVDEKEMPEIEDWKVGQEYELKIRVKVTTKDEYADGTATNSRLEVIAYEDLTDYNNDPSTPKYGFNPTKS